MGRAVIRIGGRQHRLRPATAALLTRLVLAQGQAVAADRLVREVWPERVRVPRISATDRLPLQQCVAELRKLLGPAVLATERGRATTYRLAVEPDATDVFEFVRLVEEGLSAGPDRQRTLLERALGLWHGEPLIDAAGYPFAQPVIADVLRLHHAAQAALRAASARCGEPAHIDIRRLPVPHHPTMRGRGAELAWLDAAWRDRKQRIVSIVALGGGGKSTLVFHWLRRLVAAAAGEDWIFAWSFYSQGSSDRVASAGEFVAEALRFFGDPQPDSGTTAGRGERLAGLIRARGALVVLDGLEPLQYPPGSVRAGELKDRGLRAMLQSLVFATEPCLCLITTRMPVTDLAGAEGTAVSSVDLSRLATADARDLLADLGVRGPAAELAAASEEYAGHPLALTLLASYLVNRFGGDIRRRDMIGPLTDAPDRSGHARRVMNAYETWFAGTAATRGAYELLGILGLFDRPAEPGAVRALRRTHVPGLNDRLVGMSEADVESALTVLKGARLLPPDAARDAPLDTHPLVREHFGESLRRRDGTAWRRGNELIYRHLTATTQRRPATLEALSPLYSSLYHGVRAGLAKEALDTVYRDRILRGVEFFSTRVLGAVGDDLVALSNFFERPFDVVTPGLPVQDVAFVFKQTGYCLRALGRLDDAAECMSSALQLHLDVGDTGEACVAAGLISHTYMTAGRLDLMLDFGRRACALAEQAGDPVQLVFKRSTLAYMLHQAGRLAEAVEMFGLAEREQDTGSEPDAAARAFTVFHQCDLLEGAGAFGQMRTCAEEGLAVIPDPPGRLSLGRALVELSLGRALLGLAQRGASDAIRPARHYLDTAVDRLQDSGRDDCVALALLARAELHRHLGETVEARQDLDRTAHLAQRGGMDLYLADALLGLVRLLADEGDEEAARQLHARAAAMVASIGYGRRAPEVERLAARLQA